MRFKLSSLILCLILASCAAPAQNTVPTPTTTSVVQGQNGIPAATIVNDEGGPVTVTGTLTYTNLLFTLGVSEPEIILEDEAGFVDRNRHFTIPVKSQVIGQLTSDFYSSPVSYSLSLPEAPNGDYRDVNHDGKKDKGVQIFGIAYWVNIWGDPYLEVRDLYGGGWSTAYASFSVSPDPSQNGEVNGGKYIVYSPDDQQDFPSGFGADHKLFTNDDPLVRLPQGYTVVDMDTDPFTFDRSKTPTIDLIEGQASQLDDYSQMSYTDAFDALIKQMSQEYAFTDYKHIDWNALHAKYLPEFQKAQADQDVHEYLLAVRDFSWSIPDGHVGSSAIQGLSADFQNETGGGLGMAIRELDDGRVIVNYILPSGPADLAGIKLRAEITQYNGKPIEDALSAVVPWSSPFSSPIVRKLQQLRYLLRSQVGSNVTVTYRNPGAATSQTVNLTSVAETQSFSFSSLAKGGATTGYELPIAYQLLDSGYVYVEIYSFADNSRLSIEEWERLMKDLNDNHAKGLIIDMRHNNGGSGWLADQMAAYFFSEKLDLGNTETYDKSRKAFYLDPEAETYFYPPDKQFQYLGKVAVLVGPNCSSACEFFSRDMTLQNRAQIVGQYPTGGLGGSIEAVLLPQNVYFQFPNGRNLDKNGNIIIEGVGVQPTVKVPVDETTLFASGDPVLDAAVKALNAEP